jgi:hypothetical protein
MMTVVNFSSIRNVIEWPPAVVHQWKDTDGFGGRFRSKSASDSICPEYVDKNQKQ